MGFVAGSSLGLVGLSLCIGHEDFLFFFFFFDMHFFQVMGIGQTVMMKGTMREAIVRGGQGALLSGLAFTGFLSIGAALRGCL